MDDFIKCIAKLTIVVGITLAVLLLVIAGVLIFAPELVKNLLYYGFIAFCLIAGFGIIISLIGCFLSMKR